MVYLGRECTPLSTLARIMEDDEFTMNVALPLIAYEEYGVGSGATSADSGTTTKTRTRTSLHEATSFARTANDFSFQKGDRFSFSSAYQTLLLHLRDCSNPRDRIYALLGFVEANTARVFKPDYDISPQALFARLSLWVLSYEDWGKAFLHFPLFSRSQGPSWILDFQRPFHITRATLDTYQWKQYSQKTLNLYVYKGVAHTTGIQFDRVIHTFNAPVDTGDDHGSTFRRRLEWLWKMDRHSLYNRPTRRVPEEWEASEPVSRAHRHIDKTVPWHSVVEWWSHGGDSLPHYEDDSTPRMMRSFLEGEQQHRLADLHPRYMMCLVRIQQLTWVLAAAWCIDLVRGNDYAVGNALDTGNDSAQPMAEELLHGDLDETLGGHFTHMPKWYSHWIARPVLASVWQPENETPGYRARLRIWLAATFSSLKGTPTRLTAFPTAHIPRLIRIIVRSMPESKTLEQSIPLLEEQDDLLGCVFYDATNLREQLQSLAWADRVTEDAAFP